MTTSTDRLPQHLQALERANIVREQRSKLLADIVAGRQCPGQVIADNPDCLARMTVGRYLLRIPGTGRQKMVRTLRRTGVSEHRMIGTLTERERGVLRDDIQANHPVRAPR